MNAQWTIAITTAPARCNKTLIERNTAVPTRMLG